MNQFTFDYSPALLLLCLAAGLAYAWMLYGGPSSHWSASINRILFALRTVVVFALATLLLGPLLKQTTRVFEKPVVGLVLDNSSSVGARLDSLQAKALLEELKQLSSQLEDQGYEVDVRNLQPSKEAFQGTASDLTGAIRQLQQEYENRNLANIVLVSDGIYNTGVSPLYSPSRVPITTVGVGDTIQRPDLVLKSVSYNKIAYQGNRFPLHAEVLVHHLPDQDISLVVQHEGKTIARHQMNTGRKSFLTIDFTLDAVAQGIQRFDLTLITNSVESNKGNNRVTAFVEVVAGRKKVLLIAAAPHPDIKAVRAALEKNPNYEFALHIPGVKEVPAADLVPGAADLVIVHQIPEQTGRLNALLAALLKSNTPLFFMLGRQTSVRSLGGLGLPVQYETTGQWDEVFGTVEMQNQVLGLSEDFNTLLNRVPPLVTPFGKFSFPAQAKAVLWQRIGNIPTNRPLLWLQEENDRRTGYLMAEGIWRWRLQEHVLTGQTNGTDELISKTIQYLSTRDDKRRFRAYPLQNEFTDSETVTFESQVYNAVYEPIYGHQISLDLVGEDGQHHLYTYSTSAGSIRYPIGGLKQGVYTYTATTELDGKTTTATGRFLVREQDIEGKNLTADFGLLRQLATRSGGKFYTVADWAKVRQDFSGEKPVSIIHTEDAVNLLLNLKWVFLFLLLFISMEWGIRKWQGSY